MWIEGPRSELARLIEFVRPGEDGRAAAGRRRRPARSASTGRATSPWTPFNRLTKRDPRCVAPFVYAGFGIIKPQLFHGVAEDVFRLAPFFFRAAEQGRLYGVRLDGIWLHVGRPESIAEAERAIDRSRL